MRADRSFNLFSSFKQIGDFPADCGGRGLNVCRSCVDHRRGGGSDVGHCPIDHNAIEVDTNALKTPHTCVNEVERHQQRSVILISQRFHLPRIAYQCRKQGLTGQYVEADQPQFEISSARSPFTVMRIRATRYVREAVLVWASLIGAYPEQPA